MGKKKNLTFWNQILIDLLNKITWKKLEDNFFLNYNSFLKKNVKRKSWCSYNFRSKLLRMSWNDDIITLYSCIQVNRAFCRTLVPILWRNPFKFVKDDDRLIKIFNTLIHCLDPTNKSYLVFRELIKIKDLPTPKAYFKYHTFIKEFELNPLQRGMRLWTLEYLLRLGERQVEEELAEE